MIEKLLKTDILQIDCELLNEFSLAAGEWVSFEINDASFREDFVDALLLKSSGRFSLNYFTQKAGDMDISERQEVRRRIAYWPERFEDIVDESYLRFKDEIIKSSRINETRSARLFLDHLMISETLEDRYKNLFFALLMNAPELMIVDKAWDYKNDDDMKAILSVVNRYSQNSGMALVVISSRPNSGEHFMARRFQLQSGRLVELMDNQS